MQILSKHYLGFLTNMGNFCLKNACCSKIWLGNYVNTCITGCSQYVTTYQQFQIFKLTSMIMLWDFGRQSLGLLLDYESFWYLCVATLVESPALYP